MKRVLILCGVVIALAGLPPAAARAATSSTYCTGTLAAFVSFKVTNEPLVGLDSNVWATATYTRMLAIYRAGDHTFCASTQDSGTFTTIAGTSPRGTGQISGGLTGVLSRATRTLSFTADWAPSVATSGFVGSFDSSIPWTSLFFEGSPVFGLTWSSAIYQVGGHGCFVFRLDLGGWFYDITG